MSAHEENAGCGMRFVTEQTNDEGKRPSWERLTRRWNEEQPDEWRFKDRFGLRKSYLSDEQVPWVWLR